ncbi:MAG: zinc-binding alcohol dehydrogenase family protein [Planctomycetaceae bacterium]|nr:zinc-binding alcohol dehydrogenase family protein [Planctomycetaceae bacterium]
MKAIQLEEPKRFKKIDIGQPESAGPGEAIVRVHNVGICGTDISGYLGKMPFFSYPRIPGHELGVEVVEVGSDVTNVAVGDRCSVEPYINNPESFASKRGFPNCCEDLEVLGVHKDGGLRPFFKLPARKLHKSTSLKFEQLALVETLAIGCNAVNRGNPAPEEHAMVIGAGPIGLSVIEFLKLRGCHITVLDMNQQRLDFCKNTMGVDETITFTGDEDDFVTMQDITDGHLFELVIDATGNNRSMSNAVNYVAHTGSLVYVGITTEEVCFPHPIPHRKQMSILMSRNAHPKDFDDIIEHIEQGRIDTDPWITHRTPFDDLIDNFESYTKPETGVIKAIIEVDE